MLVRRSIVLRGSGMGCESYPMTQGNDRGSKVDTLVSPTKGGISPGGKKMVYLAIWGAYK